MNKNQLTSIYRTGLLNDIVPFWIKHSVDKENGGFLFSLDRNGSVIDTDKAVWIQGRFTWLLSRLYNQVEKKEEWLELAQHGVDFIREKCFDSDGRAFFLLTKEGLPLRKRRYIFSEIFIIAALAEYSIASGETKAAKEAFDLYKKITFLLENDALPPKVNPSVRKSKSLSIPMVMICTAQILRNAIEDKHYCNKEIDKYIAEIETDFLKEEFKAALETVGPNGEFQDNFNGRLLCPGHSLELAWFILDEAVYRDYDKKLIHLGLKITDWMWNWGWDKKYGGILYYLDVKETPIQEYWHDMKFWWPQCEALIATLMAYWLTNDEKYANWHLSLHKWVFNSFPDKEYGEWFGYLHRDGRISSTLKGNYWKGPFHIPRMQLKCWQILDHMKEENYKKLDSPNQNF